MLGNSSCEKNVFINCPFDGDYRELFFGVVFTVLDCGFVARCALEKKDSGKIRIQKIADIIRDCKFGFHDISRTEVDIEHNLPRFNMPLELGMFLGAAIFDQSSTKVTLIADKERYRFQKYISDIAGQDIIAHGNSIETLIHRVRDWLNDYTDENIPGGKKMYERFCAFNAELPEICTRLEIEVSELTFTDYSWIVADWIEENEKFGLSIAA